ncbi:hypothetical protein IC614_03580 [Allosphingosinicella flava]|uniref:PEGA domain-containing protein n=1 Tax=Allosphingosinicella flava TaxID=2771430 RepID=A0A7T2LMV4_9SPHN|nr:hypothetical protein [Sphingosinicella flava]QPQ55688.1 hypothetical protein IC614_03580 [Sphingosinicella flava]
MGVRAKGWLLLPLLLTGCISGRGMAPNQPVAVQSIPSGATATTNYGSSCTTPCSLRLPNDDGGTIWIAKDGYDTATVVVGSHVDANAVARSLSEFADPTDAAIEVASGTILGDGMTRRLDKRDVRVTLTPSGAMGATNAKPIDPGAPGTVQRLSPEEIAKVQSPPLD